MLFRFLGIAVLMSACGLYGYLLKRNYLKRIYELEEFLMLLEDLKSEIQYKNCDLIENLTNINKRKIYKLFLEEVSNDLLCGQALESAWVKSCQSNLHQTALTQCDIDIISSLGSVLGISDRETQLTNIMYYKEKLQNNVNELNNGKKEKCRLYSSMGVIFGMFIGILLI